MSELNPNAVKPRHGYYIAGFVDGEGSFNVSVAQRKGYWHRWKVTACLNVSQRDRTVLSFIKKTLKCGTLRERRDGVVYYEVTNHKALYENVVPFFKRFPFLSSQKKKNFAIFKQIVEKMYYKDHCTEKGLQHILALREKLNEGWGRKRKYNSDDCS